MDFEEMEFKIMEYFEQRIPNELPSMKCDLHSESIFKSMLDNEFHPNLKRDFKLKVSWIKSIYACPDFGEFYFIFVYILVSKNVLVPL